MEKTSATHTIAAGGKIHKFAKGAPLDLGSFDLDAHMISQRVAGLIVIEDNKVRLERYGLGFDSGSRWTSFSVAKSFTSSLAGAALRDGAIKSLDDKVTAYIPGLKGSAYDEVTVRELLTMTSGVKWNEDYTDPNSDVALFGRQVPEPGLDVTVSYMKRLPRDVPAGSKWLYKTGETNLIGVLVSEATGKTLSDYLSEKIWKPYGMEKDAFGWLEPRITKSVAAAFQLPCGTTPASASSSSMAARPAATKCSPTAGSRRPPPNRPTSAPRTWLRLSVVDLR